MNQVLLVSDQAMPNFLPILNKGLKPDSVTLVVSDRMRNRSEWLKTEIAKHQVEILPDIVIGGNAMDIEGIRDSLTIWADSNVELMKESVLNVTGGTKPMAIAAQEVFRMMDRPVFYVNIDTDQVMWLDGTPPIHLENQPTLNQFFGLNGITIECGDFKSVLKNENWRHFYHEIAEDPVRWSQSIRTLNRIAFQADRDRTLDFNDAEDGLSDNWSSMLELLHADELVTYKRNGGGYRVFRSEEARRFCNGIWLEHYVFETLKSFGFDKKRALMNVCISDAKGNKNELDAIVLSRNYCYVIEDKTKNMRNENVADNAVYKLAQLASKMGLKARGILVSALAVRNADRERAKAYQVDILDSLPDLKQRLAGIFRLNG